MNPQGLQNHIRELSNKVFPNRSKPDIPLEQYGEELFTMIDNASGDGFCFATVFNEAVRTLRKRRNAVNKNDNIQIEIFKS